MKVIGLTGGIASGKSSVTNVFKEFNAYIIDGDIIAREIVEPGKPALYEIIKEFGEEILTKDKKLDRKKLGNIVFNDKNKLNALNNITHKKIIDEIKDRLKCLKKEGVYSLVLLDVALLIEMNMTKLVDEIWLVTTDEENQVKRIMARDDLSKEEALKRIKSQLSSKIKTQYANVVLENNGSMESLKEKVKHEISRVYNSLSGGVN